MPTSGFTAGRLLVALAFATACTCSNAAWGHGGGGGYTPDVSDLPPTPLKRQILDVQKKVKEGKHPPELVQRPLHEAVRAAERARGAHASGDGLHGGLLSKLGEQWVAVATALLRATELEQKASAQAKRARALRAKVKRAEALLAEQQARLGRLQAEVKSAEGAARGAAERTKEIERERVEGKKTKRSQPGGAARKEAR